VTGLLERHPSVYIASLVMAAMVMLIPRIDLGTLKEGYLWAEDGPVFISQAQAGIKSLWQPYGGYLLTYSRMSALVANWFSLPNRPAVLMSAWLLTYVSLVITIAVQGRALGLTYVQLMSAIALVSLQPAYGEVFFNITNSQWMLGAMLPLFVL